MLLLTTVMTGQVVSYPKLLVLHETHLMSIPKAVENLISLQPSYGLTFHLVQVM